MICHAFHIFNIFTSLKKVKVGSPRHLISNNARPSVPVFCNLVLVVGRQFSQKAPRKRFGFWSILPIFCSRAMWMIKIVQLWLWAGGRDPMIDWTCFDGTSLAHRHHHHYHHHRHQWWFIKSGRDLVIDWGCFAEASPAKLFLADHHDDDDDSEGISTNMFLIMTILIANYVFNCDNDDWWLDHDDYVLPDLLSEIDQYVSLGTQMFSCTHHAPFCKGWWWGGGGGWS